MSKKVTKDIVPLDLPAHEFFNHMIEKMRQNNAGQMEFSIPTEIQNARVQLHLRVELRLQDSPVMPPN
jgi:hypothetical protein